MKEYKYVCKECTGGCNLSTDDIVQNHPYACPWACGRQNWKPVPDLAELLLKKAWLDCELHRIEANHDIAIADHADRLDKVNQQIKEAQNDL